MAIIYASSTFLAWENYLTMASTHGSKGTEEVMRFMRILQNMCGPLMLSSFAVLRSEACGEQ